MQEREVPFADSTSGLATVATDDAHDVDVAAPHKLGCHVRALKDGINHEVCQVTHYRISITGSGIGATAPVSR
jgi:hypothetical protein